MFIVFKKLSQEEAQDAYDGIKRWFEDNPKRKKCHTDVFDVRRGHIKEDILSHSEDGVVIEP
tara:strand:- start:98 stop:283 length:186 start_codon:yes stop_codon:yes gene_type:complete